MRRITGTTRRRTIRKIPTRNAAASMAPTPFATAGISSSGLWSELTKARPIPVVTPRWNTTKER